MQTRGSFLLLIQFSLTVTLLLGPIGNTGVFLNTALAQADSSGSPQSFLKTQQILREQETHAWRVVGGSPSNVCAWPSTVGLGGCTGTLVHPSVVIYAAHCGTNRSQVKFGEVYNGSEGFTADIDYCEAYPEGGLLGNDYAFCILKEPVENIPIVPPLMGTDTRLLTVGRSVWAVGFGVYDNETEASGVKHEAEIPITGFEGPSDMFILAGGDGVDGCIGDSGGPLYIELPNNRGWRVFGITSYGPFPCGAGGGWAQMHLAMEWFETQSGFDLTPCHDADGKLNPGPGCHSFPLNPGVGGGQWPDRCQFGDNTSDEILDSDPEDSNLSDTDSATGIIHADTEHTDDTDSFETDGKKPHLQPGRNDENCGCSTPGRTHSVSALLRLLLR